MTIFCNAWIRAQGHAAPATCKACGDAASCPFHDADGVQVAPVGVTPHPNVCRECGAHFPVANDAGHCPVCAPRKAVGA